QRLTKASRPGRARLTRPGASVMIGDAHMPIRSILATCLPAGGAILVFGTLYGAAARAIMGVPLTLASSVFIFSGALQFALLALLSAGATILPLRVVAP